MPTVVELKKQAKEAGIIGYSRMRKAELEAALRAKARPVPVKKIKATVKSQATKTKPRVRPKEEREIEVLLQKFKEKRFSTASIKAIKTVKEWERVRDEFLKIMDRYFDIMKNHSIGREFQNSFDFQKQVQRIHSDLYMRERKGKMSSERAAWENISKSQVRDRVGYFPRGSAANPFR